VFKEGWEMKAPRRRIVGAVRFLAGFLLLAGIAALVVGLHDVSLAAGRRAVLFPGVLLVLAGVLFLGAVWQLAPIGRPGRWPGGNQPPCEQPAPVAFFLSILLGIYVFFGALTGSGAQRAIVIAVALVFVAVGALGFALFWDEIEVSLVRLGAGIALTVAGLLIGAWEFWYQNQYVPSHLYRAVAVQADLEQIGKRGGYDVLSATLGYQDVGGGPVVVLGSDYTLTGSTVVSCLRSPTPKDEASFFNGPLPDPQRSRFMSDVWEVKPASVLAVGRFVTDGKRLGPNVPASRQLIFYVRHDRYQLIRLRAQVLGISASVPLADQPPVSPKIDDGDFYDLWKLGDSGWFQRLLTGRRGWVVTRYEIVSAPGDTAASPDLRVTARTPGPTWSGNAPSSAQIESLFEKAPAVDTTETFADAELPLAPVVTQTAAKLKAEKAPKSCAAAQPPAPSSSRSASSRAQRATTNPGALTNR
jgi:hypothetical protein